MRSGFWFGGGLLAILLAIAGGGCVNSGARCLPQAEIRNLHNGPAGARHASLRPGMSGNAAAWTPPAGSERAGRWRGIIIHHTVTDHGPASYIDQLHRGRGWEGLGYNFVINNGRGAPDGKVEVGWRWLSQREGAHCRVSGDASNYYNEHTIGIALIGNFEQAPPTQAQYESLADLVAFLMRRYGFGFDAVQGHGDVGNTACPGRMFSMEELRRRVRTRL